MAILNKIPQYTLNKNNNLRIKAPEYYIDDIFDPLFNKEARAYLDAKYGLGGFGNTLAGYAEGVENALFGQNDKWGILGPGMGILSGFGRSMDKAGDFIIGGLTEGVNAFGHILGSDVPVENLLKNIFVEDEDYTGKRLLAAMANSMSGLAGGTTVDESEFTGLGWNIAGTGLDLATDPGILGGSLARKFAPNVMKPLNKSYSSLSASSKDILRNLGKNGIKSAVGEIGQLLSNYDDLMANVSLDLTVPGLRPLLSKTLEHLSQLIGTTTYRGYQDMALEDPDLAYKVQEEMLNDPNVDSYVNMANDLAMKYNITPDNPETVDLYTILSEINEKSEIQYYTPDINVPGFVKQDDATVFLNEAQDIITQQEQALNDEIINFLSPNEQGQLNNLAYELTSPTEYVENVGLYDNVATRMSELYNSSDSLGGLGYDPSDLERFILGYNNDDTPIWDVESFLDTLNLGDSELTSEGVQQYLQKEFEDIKNISKSPVTLAKSTYATQATNKAAAKYITAELTNTLLDLKKLGYIPSGVKNFNDLVDYINNDKVLKSILGKDKIYIEGVLQIPSKLSKKGEIPNVKAYDIIKNARKFTEFTDTLSKFNLEQHPIYGRFIDLGERLKTNILEPLEFKTYNATDAVFSGVSETDSLMTSNFNTLLKEHPSFFYTKDGKFDFNKLNEFRKHFKNYEIQISDDVKMSLEDFGYKIEDIESFKKAINKISKFRTVNGKKEIIFTVKNPYYELKSLIGTKESPKPLRKIFNFIFGGVDKKGIPTRNMDEVIDRIKQIKDNKIYGKNIISFTDISTKHFTEDQTTLQTMVDFDTERYFTEQLKNNLVSDVSELDNTDFTKWFGNELTGETLTKNDKLMFDIFPEYADFAKASGESLEKVIKEHAPKETRTLFQIIKEAEAVKSTAKGFNNKKPATLRMKRVENVLNKAKNVMDKYAPLDKNGNRNTSIIDMYLRIRDAVNDDIVVGTDYIKNLVTSGGFSGTILKTDSKELAALEKAIINNNAIINKEGSEIVTIFKKDLGNGETWIGYAFNTKNLKIRKNIKKLYSNQTGLQDLVFQKGIDISKYPKLKASLDKYKDIGEVLDEVQNISQDLSNKLGFSDFSEDYFKHALDEGEFGGKWLKDNLYTDLNLENLHEISTLVGNDLNIKGTFGATPYTRSLRGNMYRYNKHAKVFSTDLEYITKSTFAKGVFDNQHFQTYVDLFVNDNFKINKYAQNVDDLKRILYATEDGKYTGNLSNMILIAPKYNSETGKITGFTRFDKLSDAGLEKALKNPETILVPTHVVDTLDRLCKKDMKMSNGVYRFINKYMTIPYKFASLVNPGFLLGNLNDAYLKQATTLAQKYGTSLTEELSNVGMSVRRVIVLNNQFDTIFQKYIQSMDVTGKKLPPYARNYDYLRTSKGNQHFMEWFNSPESDKILSTQEKKLTKLWLFLNNAQPSSMFNANVQDLGDLTDFIKKSKYESANNFFEKITLGDGEYDPKNFTTWGIFANNPASNAVLKGSSIIENTFRSACILNDLTHKYSEEEILDILDIPESVEKELSEKLQVNLSEAINTMHHANFDYEDVTPMMDAFSTFIPFPTFFLKNFVYWMEVLRDNPQYIENAIRIQEGLWSQDEDELEKDEFKAEAKGRGAIPLHVNGQNMSKLFKGIYKPSPLNSMFGAFNLLNKPVENIAFRLNPALAPITRHLQDPEDVRYRPYSTNIYEKNIKSTDKEFNDLKYMFHRMNPYERTINTALRTPAKVKKGDAQLSDFMPSVFQPDF